MKGGKEKYDCSENYATEGILSLLDYKLDKRLSREKNVVWKKKKNSEAVIVLKKGKIEITLRSSER